MANYNYYDDAVSGAELPFEARRHGVVLKKRLKAADIIASDTTLTTNAKITANDIILAIRVPAGFVLTNAVSQVVTPEGGTLTVDIGLAGGQEIDAGVDWNAAAGTTVILGVADTWGADNVMGYHFSAADTIDVQYLNDTDTSEALIYIKGFMLW
ncbi:MAG: hypothetical protein ACYSU6_01325 [Planctomycetota bacterium]|jgi:hypothetical protein